MLSSPPSILDLTDKMTLNPNYEAIGKSFVQQYYAMLDNNDTRLQVANFYSVIASRFLKYRSAHTDAFFFTPYRRLSL